MSKKSIKFLASIPSYFLSLLFIYQFFFSLIFMNSSVWANINPLTLLEVKSYGGYVPESRANWQRGVRLYVDGRAVEFSQEDEYKEELLMTFSPNALGRLQKFINTLKVNPLVPVSDTTIRCADLPVTEYRAWTTSSAGGPVLFYAIKDCVDYSLPQEQGQQDQAKHLKKMVDALLFFPRG